MPSLEDVGRVVDDQEALNLGSCEECNTGNAGLPSQHADPSSNVGKELLGRARSEFRHPMVLTSGRRRHGGHFSHRGDDSKKPDEGTEIAVDQTSCTAIDKPEGVRTIGN